MTRDLVIVGAGGLAREVAWLIEDVNRCSPEAPWNILGFVEATGSRVAELNGRYPILGDDRYLTDRQTRVDAVIAMGDPAKVQSVSERLRECDHITFPNVIHPSVIWDRSSVSLGEGNVISAFTLLTTDVSLGSFNIVNPQCSIAHDVTMGDCCVLNYAVKISGGVVVEDGCLLGTGACVLQYLRVGKGAVVGAGAVVTKDVQPGDTVVGVPAHPIERSGINA